VSWRRFFRRGAWDAERRAELDSYLQIETDANIARGMTPEAARAAAHRKLGNPTLVREEIYQMNTIQWLEGVWQDARYAARVLRRSRAFAVVAIVSLTLGIGANTAIFGLIDAVRLRTLPVPHPETLAVITIDTHGRGRTGQFDGRFSRMTNPLWERIRDEQRVFPQVFAWGTARFDLSTGGQSQPVQGLWVSGGFFDALGLPPAAGRLIGQADDTRECRTPVAVISHAFWQRRFSGDPAAVGSVLKIDGVPMTIAGVSDRRFFGLDVGRTFDVAVPICTERLVRADRARLDRAEAWWLVAMARMTPGMRAETASAQFAPLSKGLLEATVSPRIPPVDAESYKQFILGAAPVGSGLSELRTEYEQPLWLLLGIAGAVLVIACGNLANLMIARGSARAREIAVRMAIGASRRRVLRQLAVESLLLAAIGAVLGTLLAGLLSRGLVALLSTPGTSYFVDLEYNWRTLGFVGGLTILTSALFGLLPAIRAARTAPAAAQLAGRGTSEGRERVFVRRVLVVGQVSLSLVLVVGALLFAGTLRNLQFADSGMTTAGVTVADFDMRRAEVPANQRTEFERRLADRVMSLPGVDAAAPVDIVPMNGNTWNDTVVVDGKPLKPYPNLNRVGRNFFAVLQIPFVAGRGFTEQDTVGTPPVAIVNEAFAQAYFQTASPLGREFQFEVSPNSPHFSYRIVGVVKNTKYSEPRDAFGPIAYLPDSQAPDRNSFMTLLIRSRAASGLPAAVIEAAREADPRILVSTRMIDAQIEGALVRERLMATLSTFFGALAALLAAVGLYGVMSYLVTRRRFEIGLRLALGAEPKRVLLMMLRESAVLVAAGLAIGVGLTFGTTRWTETLLFGLQPTEPVLLVAAALGLAFVAIGASLVPAIRAARVSPTTALRSE
jgi:putative ABC transport system permease protein